MSNWMPEVIRPEPPPWIVAELKKIDPNLRITFGYERYFVKKWALERKMSPERYHAMYASLLEQGGPRWVKQPIFDSQQPIYDAWGEVISYEQIGERDFDLMPEWEWVCYEEHLNEDFLTRVKRSYSWERNHPYSRIRFEQEQERLAKEEANKAKRRELTAEGVEEAFRDLGKHVVFGAGQQTRKHKGINEV
jgi:hypothetical protein